MAITSPASLALKNKQALEATGAFVVEPDGRVRMAANRGGGYAAPWVWAGAIPEASGNDPQSQALRVKLSLPPSDPNSAWNGSVPYDSGGPFTKHSTWDQSNGTYEGGIDWGTLLGTAAVGGLFAGPAVATALGSAAAPATAAAGSSAGAGGAAAGGAGVATAPAAAGWFSPANIIPSAISGIASIFGANQQANASSEAAQLQHQSTEEALADARKQREYEQAQYANYLGRLQPYLGLGTTASSTLQNLLARSPYTRMANSGPVPQYSTAAPRPVGSGQTPAAAAPSSFSGGSGTIKLQAPDGTIKDVNLSDAEHFKKLGAVAV